MRWFLRLPPWLAGPLYSAGFLGWSVVGLVAGAPPWALLLFAVAVLALTVAAIYWDDRRQGLI